MPLISPQEAEALILDSTETLETELVNHEDALGRVLRQDLFADRPFPPFDRVTMDGIAFRSADFENKPLLLQGLHAAGDPAPPPLKPGHCWQIMTGAALPADCDTIVPYEEVSLTETTATVTEDIEPGSLIHRLGSDAQAGDLILKSGLILGPGHLGIAATIGAVQLKVTRKPVLTILTTGDELIPPDQTPLPHQLRQSNGLTLESALRLWGPVKVSRTHITDDLEATTRGIQSALETSDLVILSGGISKGKKDFVRPALEALKGPPLFHGVAQRPGKPLAWWPGVAALPGNPNSSLTTFNRYLVPHLQKLTGGPPPRLMTRPLATPIERHPALTILLPTRVDEEGNLVALKPQNSGDFITPLSGTGFLEIPPGTGHAHQAVYRSA